MASKREALIASAEKALQKGRVDLALKEYQKVLEETPNDVNVLQKVGDLYQRMDRIPEAVAHWWKVAEHYGKDGFYLKAIAVYKKINRVDAARLDVYERLAELYGKQGLGMESKSNYQVLADHHIKSGNLAGAIGVYQRMLQADPTEIPLRGKIADLLLQAKRTAEAVKEYAHIAAMFREKGAYAEAVQVYERALKHAPESVDVLKALVPLQLEMGHVDAARAALRKALETTPRSVPLFLLAADAALLANDMAEARTYASKAQSVEPDNEDALALVVKVQLKGRRPDLAFAAAGPLADLAVKRGESKKALALLQPIAKAAPDNEELLRKIVDIGVKAGDDAITVPYRSALAEIWRKQGRVVEAAEALKACVALAPGNAEFRARLTQLEPLLPRPAAAEPAPPPGAPPEITLGGLQPSTAPPPIPASEIVAAPSSGGEEFEFELGDEELVETPPEAPPSLAGFPAVPVPTREPTKPSVPLAHVPPATPAWTAPPAAARVPEPEPMPPADTLSAAFQRLELAPGAAAVEGTPPSRFDVGWGSARPAGPAPPPASAIPSDLIIDQVGALEELPSIDDLGELGPTPSMVIRRLDDIQLTPATAPPPPRPAPADTAADEALVEADIYRKYGLVDKAIDLLKPLTARLPGHVKVREKLFELYLDRGNRADARAEAATLTVIYREQGKADRIKGLYSLMGETAPEEPGSLVEELPPAVEAPEVTELAEGAEVSEAVEVAEAVEAVEAVEVLDAAEAAETAEAAPLPPLAPAVEATPAVEAPAVELSPAPAAPPPASLEVIADFGEVEFAEPPVPAAPSPAPVPVPPPAPPPEIVVEPPSPPALAPLPQPVAPPAPPKPARATAKLSVEDLLAGTKKKPETRAPAPAPEVALPDIAALRAPAGSPTVKVRAVRPEDIQLPIPAPKTPRARHAPPTPAPGMLPPELASIAEAHRTPPPVPRLVEPAAASSAVPIPAAPEPQAPPPVAPSLPDLSLEAFDVDVVAPIAIPAPAQAPPSAPPAVEGPSAQELSEVDFCLDQGMVVDAAERLQGLEERYPSHPEVLARRQRLEGSRPAGEEARPPLEEILPEDFESVLDAELGRALTDEMVRGGGVAGEAPPAAAGPPGPTVPLDESGLFSDEQEFFNFAEELQSEIKQDVVAAAAGPGAEVSLEEIFREFKKGVEQQLSPEDFETHYNLGIAYKEMGLTDEAIGEFQISAKDPLHAVDSCSMLGLCFLEKGLPQLAIKWYRKGLETLGIREDDRLGLQYDLATVYADVGDTENAYKTFLDIYGTNASYRDVGERLKQFPTS